jgi:hypothetical protein
VQHQARKYGTTKFGLERFVNGFLDLLTIAFLGRFANKPMHLFGILGTMMFAAGMLLFTYIAGVKLWAIYLDVASTKLAEMSAFHIALASMLMGLQLFLAGFIAELVIRNKPGRNDYTIKSEI